MIWTYQKWRFNFLSSIVYKATSPNNKVYIGITTKSLECRVKEHVKRNIEALAPGGGFVFTTVHNIQAEVPPQNIVAMLEALNEYGGYQGSWHSQ